MPNLPLRTCRNAVFSVFHSFHHSWYPVSATSTRGTRLPLAKTADWFGYSGSGKRRSGPLLELSNFWVYVWPRWEMLPHPPPKVTPTRTAVWSVICRVIAINDYTAGRNKRCRHCIAFTRTVSIPYITFTIELPPMSPCICLKSQNKLPKQDII